MHSPRGVATITICKEAPTGFSFFPNKLYSPGTALYFANYFLIKNLNKGGLFEGSLSSGAILIVDDHEVVRRGIRSLLSSHPEWHVCGEAVDGIDGIEKAKALPPSVVLMDITMPRMNGFEATRIIRREVPEAKVIIISQNDPALAWPQAKEVDATAYIAKCQV